MCWAEWSNPRELRLTFPFYNRDIPDREGAAPNAYATVSESPLSIKATPAPDRLPI